MSFSKDVYRTRRWYISHEILSFHTKRSSPKRTKLTVWENLILISAKDPEEAYRKAMEHGRLNDQKVKIDGKDGYCKFKGLRDLVLVYDEIKSGAELEWRRFQVNEPDVKRMIRRKQQMQAFKVGPNGVSRRMKE